MNKKSLIYAFACTLALSSCSSSFLDQEPPLNMGENDIFSSADRIESTVSGLYAALKNSSGSYFLGGKTYIAFDNMGEDIENVSQNLNTLYATYTFAINNVSEENTTTWTRAYLAINNANTFLENLEGAKDVAGDKYEQYKAEAKFVRALAYFYLNNLYGKPYSLDPNAKSVPLRLKAQKDASDNNLKRSTVKEVYDQILADVSDVSALPDGEQSEEGTTRATKAAAYMLQMRVYMAEQNWAEAIAAGEKITGYSLASDFTSLFKTPYYTTETIFSLPMATNNTPNTQMDLAYYYQTPQVLYVDKTNGIMSDANYSSSKDARTSLVTEEIGDDGKADGNFVLNKFTDKKTKLDWVPIFRYAETLLDLSECYANNGNESKAKELLKEVRHRSLPAADDKLNIDALSGQALKDAIYKERRWEFIGEGIRGLDILRRGESVKRGDKVVATPESASYIWPIPESESLINKDLNN